MPSRPCCTPYSRIARANMGMLKEAVFDAFGVRDIVLDVSNNEIYFDHDRIAWSDMIHHFCTFGVVKVSFFVEHSATRPTT